MSPCLRPCAPGVSPCLWPGMNPFLGNVGSGVRLAQDLVDSSASSCLGYYGLWFDSMPMDHAYSCVSVCLGTVGSVVRPSLGPVGSGVSLCLGPCRCVCETLPMTLWTRVNPCLGHMLRTPAKAVVNIYH